MTARWSVIVLAVAVAATVAVPSPVLGDPLPWHDAGASASEPRAGEDDAQASALRATEQDAASDADGENDATTPGNSTPTPFPACPDVPRSRFTDRDRAGVHATSVDCVVWWAVTSGFPDNTFRPGEQVTRGQLASFVATAILAAGGELPPPGADRPDTRDSVHRRAIARLLAAGIVGGFADGSFRPATSVSRGQLASFLASMLDHLEVRSASWSQDGSAPNAVTAGTPMFRDVAGTTHERSIARVAAAGIVTGYADGTFRPDQPVTRAQMATMLVGALEQVTTAGTPPRAAHAAVDRAAFAEEICWSSVGDVPQADQLLAGIYTFSPHPPTRLGTNLTWTEDPFREPNWRFQLHALRWLFPLVGASVREQDPRYLDHALTMARSWVRANPPQSPASFAAWTDHATAWRAVVFGCLALHRTPPGWLETSMAEHRTMLADPSFYVSDGNHALNQDVGLLVLACLTDAWDLRDLAAERIGRLARRSIDADGVTDEQAVEYQHYNYERYLAALNVHDACGMPTPSWASRLERMPVVLAHLTQPDGIHTPLGDTDRRALSRHFDHPALVWIRTGGASGQPPSETFVSYDAGFTVARSGWGTERPLAQETHLTLRHGPPPFLHGHDDHGSITLYALGQPLLTDPGKYAYVATPERRHIESRQAHNVVTVGEDCGVDPSRSSTVRWTARDEHTDRVVVDVSTCPGTGWVRTIAFVRDTGEVVIVDETRGPASAPVVQRWQLEIGAQVSIARRGLAVARWPSGATLMVEQLVPVQGSEVVSGARSPLRGWVSPSYGELVAAPNLTFRATDGGRATFVTVLRPGATESDRGSALVLGSSTLRVTLPTDNGAERTIELPREVP